VEKRVSFFISRFSVREHFYLTRRAVAAAAAFIRNTIKENRAHTLWEENGNI
jgi:hypothetical protein